MDKELTAISFVIVYSPREGFSVPTRGRKPKKEKLFYEPRNFYTFGWDREQIESAYVASLTLTHINQLVRGGSINPNVDKVYIVSIRLGGRGSSPSSSLANLWQGEIKYPKWEDISFLFLPQCVKTGETGFKELLTRHAYGHSTFIDEDSTSRNFYYIEAGWADIEGSMLTLKSFPDAHPSTVENYSVNFETLCGSIKDYYCKHYDNKVVSAANFPNKIYKKEDYGYSSQYDYNLRLFRKQPWVEEFMGESPVASSDP